MPDTQGALSGMSGRCGGRRSHSSTLPKHMHTKMVATPCSPIKFLWYMTAWMENPLLDPCVSTSAWECSCSAQKKGFLHRWTSTLLTYLVYVSQKLFPTVNVSCFLCGSMLTRCQVFIIFNVMNQCLIIFNVMNQCIFIVFGGLILSWDDNSDDAGM